MLIVKIHEARGKRVAAVCDSELIGKRFTQDNLQLDLSSRFYAGEEMREESFESIMDGFDVINMVGERAIAVAIKHGLIKEQDVIRISGIPHAQVLNLDPIR
ncbi:DUF424 domain-containing protein [Candidatus Woesearchaeota archaeon]|nr:DUF424 family protein [Candidatus Woesearchaeota archaeon]RLE43156.1 MAG: DUF424 domain-containing protein [Candidatus Woesearchaeota archaeon]